jgi:hypothetical protein
MSQVPFALQFVVLAVSGWLTHRQQFAIEYLLEENRVLRQQLGNRRLRLTDAQRRRLAVRGRKLERKVLDELAGLVTPDTILRWYRTLVARKYDGSKKRGRACRRDKMAFRERELAEPMPPSAWTDVATDRSVLLAQQGIGRAVPFDGPGHPVHREGHVGQSVAPQELRERPEHRPGSPDLETVGIAGAGGAVEAAEELERAVDEVQVGGHDP